MIYSKRPTSYVTATPDDGPWLRETWTHWELKIFRVLSDKGQLTIGEMQKEIGIGFGVASQILPWAVRQKILCSAFIKVKKKNRLGEPPREHFMLPR